MDDQWSDRGLEGGEEGGGRGGAFTTEKGLDSGTNGNQKLHAFQLTSVDYICLLSSFSQLLC